MRPRPRQTAASLLATLLLVVGAAGCGSSSTDTATAPNSSTANAGVAPTSTTDDSASPAETTGDSAPPATTTDDSATPATSTSDSGNALPPSACALLTAARAKQVIPDAVHHGVKDPPVICSYASKNVSTGKKGQTLTLLWSRKKVSAANLAAAFDQSNADLSGGATLKAVTGIGERANLISSPGAGATVIWTQDGYLLVCSYLDYSGAGSPTAITAVENIARAMANSF